MATHEVTFPIADPAEIMKLRAGDTLVVASHNAGKVGEIRELLMPFRLHVVGANELELETGGVAKDQIEQFDQGQRE